MLISNGIAVAIYRSFYFTVSQAPEVMTVGRGNTVGDTPRSEVVYSNMWDEITRKYWSITPVVRIFQKSGRSRLVTSLSFSGRVAEA